MKCPQCAGPAKLTRNDGKRRAYWCRACKFAFWTKELATADLEVHAMRVMRLTVDMARKQLTDAARRVLRAKGYLL